MDEEVLNSADEEVVDAGASVPDDLVDEMDADDEDEEDDDAETV